MDDDSSSHAAHRIPRPRSGSAAEEGIAEEGPGRDPRSGPGRPPRRSGVPTPRLLRCSD